MRKGKDTLIMILFGIFAAVGIILLAIAAFLAISSTKFGQASEPVTGVITSILGILGSVFTLIGVIPCIVMLRKRKQNQKLLAAGYVLHAQVESIELNRNISMNGTHPYIVYCIYKDVYSGTLYRFKSGSIWTNPESVLYKGAMIDVYVDEKDYSKYYVAVNEVLQGKIVDFT